MTDEPRKFKSYAILFVDDEEKALKYFERAFSSEFWVLTADSAAQAEKVLQQHGDAIGILITDQRMPEATGADLLKYVREEFPNIVRMLTTAYSDLDAAIAAINNGEIFRYITKPWNVDNLRGELIQAMNYFYVRHERDLLLQEKLSIWQRLVTVDKARDMLVMSGGVCTLRNTTQAVTAYLMQYPLIENQKALEDKAFQHFLDPWQFMQKEIQKSIALARYICELNSSPKATEPVDLNKILDETANRNSTADIAVNVAEETCLIKADNKMISQLVDSIIRFLLAASNIVTIETGSKEEAVYIRFRNKNATLNEGADHTAPDKDLLTAFFIAYHLGGQIKLDRSNTLETGLTLEIPCDTETVAQSVPAENWLTRIFAQYENI